MPPGVRMASPRSYAPVRTSLPVRAAQACAAGTLAVSFAPSAWGTETRVDVRVEAAGPCADAAAFQRAIRARSARVRHAEGAASTIRFTTATSDEGAHGELSVSTAQGDTVLRTVSAARCEEVVSGLAFIAALMFDPEATPPESAPAEPPTGFVAPRADGHAASAPSTSARGDAPSPAARDEEPTRAPSGAVPTTSRTRAPAAEAGKTQPSARPLGMAPELVVRGWGAALGLDGPAIGGGVELGARQAHAAVSPTLRGGLALARGSAASDGTVEATVALVAARLELCVPVVASARVALSPCVAGVVGALTLDPSGVEDARAPSRIFGALEGLARISVPLTRWLTAELSPGLLVPMVRDRYVVANLGELYRPPAAAVMLSFGLGVHFP